MNNWLDEMDFDATVKDYDFTRRAVQKMNRAVEAADFENMDAKLIFRHLFQEMEIVSFKDFLKRYIYERAEIREPFQMVPDELYREILEDTFQENNVPFSMTPTTKKKTAIIKSWLSQDCVKRSTIFLLGFGLRMSEEDVYEFLTKVIKEDGFHFWDSEETIYWYCYRNGLSYAKATELINKYCREESKQDKICDVNIVNLGNQTEPQIHSEKELGAYVHCIRKMKVVEGRQMIAYEQLDKLYAHVQQTIAAMYQKEGDIENNHKTYTAEKITPADVEKVLCSGIPLTGSGNLAKMSASLLARQFENKRLSRQRLDNLLKRKLKVERFDLITLLFLIFAEEVEPDWPTERYLQYIEKINEILEKCGMMGIYPVNPYEAFVLMCLLSDYPLNVYTEIWEMSYQE